MKLSVERNTNPENNERIPYHIVLEIVNTTADIGKIYHIPVYITYVGVSKHFHVEICGVRLNALGKPYNLLESAELLCRSLINVSRFPSYVFIARRAKHVYPAYTIDDEVFITTQGGGPVFRHVELAKVRERLTEYLHRIKVLGADGKSDKLHVRGINPHTLGLRRPVMYLKKRVIGEEDFWAPVFVSGDGQAIYTYAASNRRETPIDSGREVFRLRDLVAAALQVDHRLRDLFDLRADRLMPETWSAVQTLLTPEDQVMVSGRKYPIFSAEHNRLWLAIEGRPEEDRYGLYMGSTPEDVVARMTRDFARRSVKYEYEF